MHTFVTWCNNRRLSTLKIISIDIVTNNVERKIIHSNLYVNIQNESNHKSLQSNIFRIDKTIKNLKKIKIFIIDEIFMINNEMLSFVFKLFEKIHKKNFFFENFHIIVFDDLLQLFSIRKRQIFYFLIWNKFISLFLKRSKKHDNDFEFERFLKIIRFDKIIDEIINVFHRKKQKFQIEKLIYKCTSLHFKKDEIQKFNVLLLTRICNSNVVIYIVENKKLDKKLIESIHKRLVKKKFFFNRIIIVFETRIMFLKNKFIRWKIINDNCDLIIKINENDFSIVIFSMMNRIKMNSKYAMKL